MSDIYDSAINLRKALCGKVPYVLWVHVSRRVLGAKFTKPKIIVKIVTSNVSELQTILPQIPPTHNSFETHIEIADPPQLWRPKL